MATVSHHTFPQPQHSCDAEIRATGPSSLIALDGDLWACSCGRLWVHICDEAEGCYWVPAESYGDDEELVPA
jgi:hypothetical protein